jgi:hypothetical protein
MAIDSYRAGLCVGHLVVRARAAFAPADARPLAERRSARAIEIWPARAPARWPPQDGLVRIRSFDAAFEREADLARLAA